MLKTFVLLNIFAETMILFPGFFDKYKVQLYLKLNFSNTTLPLSLLINLIKPSSAKVFFDFFQ